MPPSIRSARAGPTAPRAPRAPRPRLALLAALALAALAGCGRGPDRAARAAADTAAAIDSLPPLEPSVVATPVEYDLQPAIAALEAAVPRAFGDLAARRPVAAHPRLSIAFAGQRSPFRVRVRGSTVTIEAIVTYQGKGWYRLPMMPDVGASCGTGGESPRLRVALETTVGLASDWSLRSRTRVPIVEPASDGARDRCRVTAVRYDVTERVLEAARGHLEGKAELVDERLARTNVRDRVERWWGLLQRPIRLRDDLWLELRPADVTLGRLSAERGALLAPVRLTANPRLVTGARPDSATDPLPDLAAAAPGAVAPDTGLRVRLDAELDYATASRVLSGQLVGRSFERGGRRVVVRAASVRSAPGGRLALALAVTGDADGIVRLVGRPTFDAERGELRVHDLDYDLSSGNVVVRGLDWLRHEELRDLLRARARWPAADLVDRARARVETALNRDLAEGVRLSATVPAARVLAVQAGRDAIVLRAEAAGDVSLRVSREVRAPRRRRAGD